MPSPKARFTQSDVTRILRAMKNAEFDGHLEIRPDGTMILRPGKGEPRSEESALERWKRLRAAGEVDLPDRPPRKRIRL